MVNLVVKSFGDLRKVEGALGRKNKHRGEGNPPNWLTGTERHKRLWYGLPIKLFASVTHWRFCSKLFPCSVCRRLFAHQPNGSHRSDLILARVLLISKKRCRSLLPCHLQRLAASVLALPLNLGQASTNNDDHTRADESPFLRSALLQLKKNFFLEERILAQQNPTRQYSNNSTFQCHYLWNTDLMKAFVFHFIRIRHEKS